MHVRLTEDRRETILRGLTDLHAEQFDEELSRFRAERIVDFFIKTLGPPVYNQAIQDARGYMLERLDDLDATFYEEEDASEPGDA